MRLGILTSQPRPGRDQCKTYPMGPELSLASTPSPPAVRLGGFPPPPGASCLVAGGTALHHLHGWLSLPMRSAGGCGGRWFLDPTRGSSPGAGPPAAGVVTIGAMGTPTETCSAASSSTDLPFPRGLFAFLRPAKEVGHRRHDHSVGRAEGRIVETYNVRSG